MCVCVTRREPVSVRAIGRGRGADQQAVAVPALRHREARLSIAVVDQSHWATVPPEDGVAGRMQLTGQAAPSDDA